MARLTIVEYPDERLRTPCAAVTDFDGALGALIDDLVETLHASPGIGLCAPQTGCLQRVVVADLSDDGSDPHVYVNPEIVSRAGLAVVDERCLSLPGICAKIVRAAKVHVRAADRAGHPFERELDGMHAVCLQHEIDHLDGRLFTDRLSRPRRWRLRGALAALERGAAERAAERANGADAAPRGFSPGSS